MTSVKRFEELKCWQEGRKLVNLVYQATSKKIFIDYSLKDQIRRAAVSIISNIAEGFERGNREEFVYFLYIAKGSCGEVRTQLYIALDLSFINQADFLKATNQARLISGMIYRLIESIKVSKFKGLRYKANITPKDDWQEFLKDKYPDIHEKLYNKEN